MIKYYQRTIKEQKLKTLKSFQVGSLIYASQPKEEEISYLVKTLNLDRSIVEDALDPHEVPRMEIKKNITYIFARVPKEDSSIRRISTFPITFIIGKDFLLIFSQENADFLISSLKNHKKYYTTQRTRLFIKMFFEVENVYSNLLNVISKRINYFSINVGGVKESDIVNFVRYEVVLNEFISSLLPMRHVLSSVMSGKALGLYDHDRELIEDLQLNSEQLIERSRSNLANLVNIRQAQEVISTNRLNRIITVLTVSTVILTLPTMITSFYGMNVKLPFANSNYAFLVISSSVVVLIMAIFIFLRKMKII